MLFATTTVAAAFFAPLILGAAIPSDSSNILQKRTTLVCPGGLNNSVYTVQPGDSVLEIPLFKNVSTLTFLNENNLNKSSSLIAGQQLCIPPPCTIYRVLPTNDCSGIAYKFNLTNDYFFGVNPGINDPECNNMEAGSNVCLDTPRGANHPNPSIKSP